MASVVRLDLPVDGSGCDRVRITADSTEVVVEYQYFCAGKAWIGGIVFADTIAYRFRNELHSLGFDSESFDALVEILESQWLLELARIEPPNIRRGVNGMHHFAVQFSSNGYFEVIAADFEELPRVVGELGTPIEERGHSIPQGPRNSSR